VAERNDERWPTLTFGVVETALRAELRSWLGSHAPEPPSGAYERAVFELIDWQAALHAAGFIGLSWPPQYGGRGLSLAAEAVLAEELATTAMPELINRLALYTWGPTLLAHGSDEQRDRLLPGMLDASEIWCQGFSEPAAGSDLAAITTSAKVSKDRLVVTGQKVWTSRAELSKWNALLVRTDPDAPRRTALSVVIVDMESPGIVVSPLLQMLHEPHFSEVFFDGVEVPIANVLGGVGNGWDIAMKAMSYERGLFVLERSTRLRRRLSDLGRHFTDAPGRGAEVAARVGALCAELEGLRAHVYQTLDRQASGSLLPGATSIDKLLLTYADENLFGTAYDLLGSETSLSDDGWAHDLLVSRSVGIYSGTSEIQRNIIGQQLLGLSRPL
jgi:alkylation response protein AidB-like acyl-CoA dehydrogenase